jgi:hypothetical protein
MKFVIFDGRIVQLKKLADGEAERLVLDAKRIMGLHPALYNGHNISISGYYLKPPKKNSSTRRYAENILSLTAPILKVWDGYPRYISSRDAEELQ